MNPLYLLVAAVSGMLTCCGQSARTASFTEKTIVIAAKQTVDLKEIDLSITNNGCGRKWVSDGDKPSFERAYCELEIDYRGEHSHAGSNSDTVKIRDIRLVVQRMNPWGREEDSIPAGGCRVWIKQLR